MRLVVLYKTLDWGWDALPLPRAAMGDWWCLNGLCCLDGSAVSTLFSWSERGPFLSKCPCFYELSTGCVDGASSLRFLCVGINDSSTGRLLEPRVTRRQRWGHMVTSVDGWRRTCKDSLCSTCDFPSRLKWFQNKKIFQNSTTNCPVYVDRHSFSVVLLSTYLVSRGVKWFKSIRRKILEITHNF